MPRVTDVTSESGSEIQLQTGSTKKTYATKKRRAASVSDSVVEELQDHGPEETAAESEDGDEEEEGEGEEEYEIEKILDAKKGQFPGGRMGYFVKWKNYDEEHNSWVDERDAGNAQELIDTFWAEHKKNKSAVRKSEPIKLKPQLVEKPSRKSLVHVDSSIEPENLAKKRGRAKKDDVPSDKVETRDEDDDQQRVKKKPRKSNGLANKRDPEEEIIGTMKKHMKAPSWEDLIESIDTVEREEDGELYVFFTLKSDKKRVRENSRLCAEKFPQKLIMFYESNLRWKTEEDPTEG